MTMDDENEANEAVKELDGSKVGGERIRVEARRLPRDSLEDFLEHWCARCRREESLGVAHLHDAAGAGTSPPSPPIGPHL